MTDLISKDITILGKEYAVREDGMIYQHSYVDNAKKLRKGKWLKPSLSGNGYLKLGFRNGNQWKNLYVHQIVCKAFNGECPVSILDQTVDHIDNDKYNNHHTNLQWMERSDNVKKKIISEEECKRRSEFMKKRHEEKDPSLFNYQSK